MPSSFRCCSIATTFENCNVKYLRPPYVLLVLFILLVTLETPRAKLLYLGSTAWLFVYDGWQQQRLRNLPNPIILHHFRGGRAAHGMGTEDGHAIYFDEKISTWSSGDQIAWEYVGEGKIRLTNLRNGETVLAEYFGRDRTLGGY